MLQVRLFILTTLVKAAEFSIVMLLCSISGKEPGAGDLRGTLQVGRGHAEERRVQDEDDCGAAGGRLCQTDHTGQGRYTNTYLFLLL